MSHKTTISLRGHAYEKLWMAKPARMNFSEWIETLALKGLEDKPVAALEGQHAPTSFCTLSDSLVDGSRAYGLVMRRKGQAPVLMLSVVEGEPVVEEELFAE